MSCSYAQSDFCFKEHSDICPCVLFVHQQNIPVLIFSAFVGFKHSLSSPELLCVTTEEGMALKQQPGTGCNNSKCDEVQSRSEEQGLDFAGGCGTGITKGDGEWDRYAPGAAEGKASRHASLSPVHPACAEWLQEGSVRSAVAGDLPCSVYERLLSSINEAELWVTTVVKVPESMGESRRMKHSKPSLPRNICLCCPSEWPQDHFDEHCFSTGWGSVNADVHKICRVPGQFAGFSCCKPLLLYVEIYGCLSLIKMDVLSRLQVSHVSCQMSRSVLKYGGEGRGVEVSSDLGRTTLDNFSFEGEMESHCTAVKLASLNPAQLSKFGSCCHAATYGIQNELVISIKFWWSAIHIRKPIISKWPSFAVRLCRRAMGWTGHWE